MITPIYFIVSVVAFSVLVWGLRLYGKYRDVVFLLITSTLFLLWYDSFIIGIGSTLGEGALLKTLSWPRYIGHSLLLPIWIIAAGAMARRADFAWAQPKWVMAFFCLLATAGIGLGLYEIFHLDLFPACLKGTLRYVPYVADYQACSPDMAGMGHAPKGPPPVPIFSTLLFLFIGLAMWIRRKWPWLFLGSLVMFVMAGMPQSIAGPLISNIGEPIISAAALLTARHFVRKKQAHHG